MRYYTLIYYTMFLYLGGFFGCNRLGENKNNKLEGGQYNSGLAMTCFDIDGDRDLDLIVGAKLPKEATGGALSLMKNEDGRLLSSISLANISMTENAGIAMTSGDINSDGYLDLIVGVKAQDRDNALIYLFFNDGKGNFTR